MTDVDDIHRRMMKREPTGITAREFFETLRKHTFKRGDRVVYSGEVVNENWDPTLQGTVLSTFDDGRRIDVKWDNGATNYGHHSIDFSLAPEED